MSFYKYQNRLAPAGFILWSLKSWRLNVIQCLVLLLLIGSLSPKALAQDGRLQLGEFRRDHDQITLPVALEGNVGQGVAAVDFRLRYDPNVFEPVQVEAGPAATAANKLVRANMVQPGEYIVLMFGMNQNAAGNGDVAEVTMRVVSPPEGGESELRITDTTISRGDATGIASRGSTRMIRFEGDAPADSRSIDESPEDSPGDDAGTNGDQPAEDNPAPPDPVFIADSGAASLPDPGGNNGANLVGDAASADNESGGASGGRLGNLEELLNRMRQATNLRGNLPRGGTGGTTTDPDPESDQGTEFTRVASETGNTKSGVPAEPRPSSIPTGGTLNTEREEEPIRGDESATSAALSDNTGQGTSENAAAARTRSDTILLVVGLAVALGAMVAALYGVSRKRRG